MFELVAVSVALVGSSIAGAYDLKTTEIPDWTSIGMIVIGLGLAAFRSVFQWNPTFFFMSASISSVFFTFGVLMYLGGQWGGGDAKVLAGIGALIPVLPSFSPAQVGVPFPLVLILNVFLVGAAYITGYAFIFAFLNDETVRDFGEELKDNSLRLVSLSIFPPIGLLVFSYLTLGVFGYQFLYLIPGIFGMLFLVRFLKVVEREGFKEEISTEELEAGDMLTDSVEEVSSTYSPQEELKEIAMILCPILALPLAMYIAGFTGNIYFWLSLFPGIAGAFLYLVYILDVVDESKQRIRGLKEDEVEEIREKRDTIEVREGVRFAPVFPLAIIASIYLGNIVFLIF